MTETEVNGHFFGHCSLTLVLHGTEPRALQQQTAEASKAIAVHDGAVFEETYNLLNAWLSVIPGNGCHNLRRLALLKTNAAEHLHFLHALVRVLLEGDGRHVVMERDVGDESNREGDVEHTDEGPAWGDRLGIRKSVDLSISLQDEANHRIAQTHYRARPLRPRELSGLGQNWDTARQDLL